MINYELRKNTKQRRSRLSVPLVVSVFCLLGGSTSFVHATEPERHTYNGGDGGSSALSQQQAQAQGQAQFQEQNQAQTQRQGDNSVDVDGDDNDYLALALPNLVAANCAGQSYSVGAGGAGFGFGLGQALIDENCQIAKAIATAHLLQKTGLVSLNTYEYRHALCQMRGMEHVCKAMKTDPTGPKVHCKIRKTYDNYPVWCRDRVANYKKASQWRDRDLQLCGLKRETFVTDIKGWGTQEYCEPVVKTVPPKPGNPYENPKKPSYVVVRTGEHCDYDRVVFDWPKPVDYELTRYDDTIAVNFKRDSKIDVSNVSKSLGRYILKARSENDEKETRVTFTVSDGVDHRVWKWGHRVIVDIRKPGCTYS